MNKTIITLTALACIFSLTATAAENDVIKTGELIGAHLGEGTPLTTTYGKPAHLLDSPSSVPGTSEVMMWKVGDGILVIETSYSAGIIKNLSYVITDSKEQKRTTLKVKEFNPTTGEITIVIPNKALQEPQTSRTRSYIKAEVRGLLVFKDSRYRVIVRPQEEPKKELALDLWVSENNVLVRQLQELQDKQVVVTGMIVWVPKGTTIKADEDYTLGLEQFEIRKAEEK